MGSQLSGSSSATHVSGTVWSGTYRCLIDSVPWVDHVGLVRLLVSERVHEKGQSNESGVSA
jgi:hypothetical protein